MNIPPFWRIYPSQIGDKIPPFCFFLYYLMVTFNNIKVSIQSFNMEKEVVGQWLYSTSIRGILQFQYGLLSILLIKLTPHILHIVLIKVSGILFVCCKCLIQGLLPVLLLESFNHWCISNFQPSMTKLAHLWSNPHSFSRNKSGLNHLIIHW